MNHKKRILRFACAVLAVALACPTTPLMQVAVSADFSTPLASESLEVEQNDIDLLPPTGEKVPAADSVKDLSAEEFSSNQKEVSQKNLETVLANEEEEPTEQPPLKAVYAYAPVRGINSGDTAQIELYGRLEGHGRADLTEAQITYKSSNESILSVSEDGMITAVNDGKAEIQIQVELDSETVTRLLDVVVGAAKDASSIYTDKKRKTAQENAQIYDWAQEEADQAIAIADKYLDRVDDIWELMTTQSLSRGTTTGLKKCPKLGVCAYCGTDLIPEFGRYGYLMDPLNDPWKIQCPVCENKFPSNDFEAYYESGKNEFGEFVPALADPQYLVNTLYPEKNTEDEPNWGVEDGYGYDTGRVSSNGVKEVKPFIAYFVHWGIWYTDTNNTTENAGVVRTALNAFRDAYIATGDEKYGRAGAILIDRVADVYPELDLSEYPLYTNSEGGTCEGKISGSIWEAQIATDLALAYDAFYPAMDDQEVIDYLSEKAEKYQMLNPKDSGNLIRQNCEYGILREIWDGFKTAKVRGNFGMHQNALTTAAVALDTFPETKEWIDYVFQAGSFVSKPTNHITGGNMLPQLVNNVNRDGHGNETAPFYNYMWLEQISGVADVLDGYEGYAAADLYQNPKLIKMYSAMYPLILASKYTAEIGDSGRPDDNPRIINKLADAVKGFDKTGDPVLAQLAYMLNGNSVKGLHTGIMTENPEEIASEIEQIVKEKGTLNLTSENQTGNGFAVMRAGQMENKAGVDTQQDFWMHYGETLLSHAHADKLNLGIHAYGIDMAPDLGYPQKNRQRSQPSAMGEKHNQP